MATAIPVKLLHIFWGIWASVLILMTQILYHLLSCLSGPCFQQNLFSWSPWATREERQCAPRVSTLSSQSSLCLLKKFTQSKCYGEPTIDVYSKPGYSQWKVFILASWDYTQAFRDPCIGLSVQSTGCSKAKAYPGMALGSCKEITSQKQTVSLELREAVSCRECFMGWGLTGSCAKWPGTSWLVLPRTELGNFPRDILSILVKPEMTSAKTQDVGTPALGCPVMVYAECSGAKCLLTWKINT